jgi:hypothetical protein
MLISPIMYWLQALTDQFTFFVFSALEVRQSPYPLALGCDGLSYGMEQSR